MYAEAENMFYHLSTVSVASMSGRGVEQTAVADADLMGEFLLGVGAAFQKKFYQANCQRAHDVSSSLFILVEFRPSYSINKVLNFHRKSGDIFCQTGNLLAANCCMASDCKWAVIKIKSALQSCFSIKLYISIPVPSRILISEQITSHRCDAINGSASCTLDAMDT